MPNQNNNQSSNLNNQTDDSKPVVSFPVVEDTLPPMPASPDASLGAPDIANPSPADTNSGSAAPNNDLITPQVIGTIPPPAKKFVGGKIIATILGLFLLVGGVGAGVFLTGQNQNISEKAANENYRDELKCCSNTNNGDCKHCLVQNNGTCTGGPIHCNDSGFTRDDNPNDYDCSPVVEGCGDDGGGEPGLGQSCTEPIHAYNRNWERLSSVWLAKLHEGSEIKFAIPSTLTIQRNGGSVTVNLDGARFTINGDRKPMVTTKSPSGDFYIDYTIPAGVTQFNITVELRYGTVWITG